MGMILNPYLSAYVPGAMDFDGTMYGAYSATPTGVVDGKQLLFATSFRIDAIGASDKVLFNVKNSNSAVHCRLIRTDSTHATITLQGFTAAGALVFDLSGATSLAVGASWNTLCGSVDTDVPNSGDLYLNDAAEATSDPSAGATMDFATGLFGALSRPDGSFAFNGCVADFWLGFGQYLDLSTEANRRKFFTSANKLVHLGSNGSTPTGSQPHFFFKGGDFSTNLGSAGDTNYTLTGTPTTCSSVP